MVSISLWLITSGEPPHYLWTETCVEQLETALQNGPRVEEGTQTPFSLNTAFFSSWMKVVLEDREPSDLRKLRAALRPTVSET